jgi:hypothetical protein
MNQKRKTPPAPVTAKAAPPVVGPTTVTLTRRTTPRKGSSVVYSLPAGLRGTVKCARSVFGSVLPDSLTLTGHGFARPVAMLTKEERAAARAAMTPTEKATKARALANRAMARAAKLEAAAVAS